MVHFWGKSMKKEEKINPKKELEQAIREHKKKLNALKSRQDRLLLEESLSSEFKKK